MRPDVSYCEPWQWQSQPPYSPCGAVGVAAVFLEVHQDPDHAPSDGPNMVKLKDMPGLLSELKAFDALSKHRGAEI